jgi:hypothetical protein
MKPFSEMSDRELAAALQAFRPEPSPTFVAELDERAAAGFPRRSRQRGRNPFARAAAWIRDGSKLRLVIPAGGVAVAAIAVATVVAVGSGSGGSGSDALTQMGGEMSVEKAAPEVEAAAGEAGDAAAIPQSAPAVPHRQIERNSDVVVATEPEDVGEASSKVFETVHAYDGVVLDSSTRDGSGTRPEATFELLIPSGKVGDAMAAFSRIGEVVSRHEQTTDITAPTVGTNERLQDSEARIEGLLAQLGEATTDSEREAVEAVLGSERRHAANLKSKLAGLHQRADLSRVTVRIDGGRGAVSPSGDEEEGWGIGSALDDAGHLLSVAAGVTIVALAVLSPLLLLALLAWLAGRTWTRRARERALT